MADTSIKTKYGTARLIHGHYRIDSLEALQIWTGQ